LWNIPVVESIGLESFIDFASSKTLLAFDGNGSRSLNDIGPLDEFSLIFGNEARGLPNLPGNVEIVSIPMKGYAESFNVASAAAIAMFHVSR
jgi:TrmH family RNA methyltransferase